MQSLYLTLSYIALFYWKPCWPLIKSLTALILGRWHCDKELATLSTFVFTDDHLLPRSTRKLGLLKLWMRIQNRFFFSKRWPHPTTAGICSSTAGEKSPLDEPNLPSRGGMNNCYYNQQEMMSYFQKESVKRGMREGKGSQGCWKAEDTQERWEGGVGDVRWWSSGSSSKGFVWNLSRSSTRWGLEALHSHANNTPHSTVSHSHDVITFWTRLCFCFFLQP